MLSACAAATPPPEPVTAKPEPQDPGPLAERWMLPSKILDGREKTLVSEEALIERLLGAKVVYVGEKHHSPHDHAVQLRIVHLLRERDPSIGIGLEMVKRPFQGGLDRYLGGQIHEEQLLTEVEWEERWGYSFFLYRPIFRYAKEHGIPIYALNAPDEITEKVARGGLDSLDSTERESLPDLDLENTAYEAVVREAFAGHHDGSMSFENFYIAQVIWDETMAYEVARILRTDGGPKRLVVLAGGGHVEDGHGIPVRAAKRGAAPHATILPLLLKNDGPTIDEALADPGGDFVWLMGEAVEALP
jgi:uncharacterized iron-regulated protein